ncbi:MAG: hypothetical protein FuRV3_gp2 [Hangzhou rhabdovirus 3]|nr:MAG: hypothetical protein FuRV3_gp2 [Hangzhou rhabdovirus 3]
MDPSKRISDDLFSKIDNIPSFKMSWSQDEEEDLSFCYAKDEPKSSGGLSPSPVSSKTSSRSTSPRMDKKEDLTTVKSNFNTLPEDAEFYKEISKDIDFSDPKCGLLLAKKLAIKDKYKEFSTYYQLNHKKIPNTLFMETVPELFKEGSLITPFVVLKMLHASVSTSVYRDEVDKDNLEEALKNQIRDLENLKHGYQEKFDQLVLDNNHMAEMIINMSDQIKKLEKLDQLDVLSKISKKPILSNDPIIPTPGPSPIPNPEKIIFGPVVFKFKDNCWKVIYDKSLNMIQKNRMKEVIRFITIENIPKLANLDFLTYDQISTTFETYHNDFDVFLSVLKGQ